MAGVSSMATAVALGLGRETGREFSCVVTVEHELGAIGEAARVVACQREVGRKCRIRAHAADRRGEFRRDALHVYAAMRALVQTRALARGHVNARIGSRTREHADECCAERRLITELERQRIDTPIRGRSY